MIHDACVEVTCDTPGCRSSTYVRLDYAYGGLMHTDGRYDDSDSKVERKLQEEGWIVRDGKHYCGDMCAPAPAAPKRKRKTSTSSYPFCPWVLRRSVT